MIPALAASPSWTHQIERGLDVYSVKSGPITLHLICDPDMAYLTRSYSNLRIEAGGDDDRSGPVTIRFEDGTSATASMHRGAIAKDDAAEETWQAILDGLRGNSALTLDFGHGVVLPVETGKAPNFSCKSS
ncbi:hypothetical protein [Notoacmeibacter ruber]|uniref:Uncharacterized protein n=1 Tax=Notoacmeibacter ruber TaxID=2670375 RepID=A0A3L7J399_9HYPH|nr:hypothetical protein [Notoacmeibacter ruber]RLQ84974.1 hypothetical protein D8780_15415 [Notoacmeibacter ruber]